MRAVNQSMQQCATVCSNCSIMVVRHCWKVFHLIEHQKIAGLAQFHLSRPQNIEIIIKNPFFRDAIENTKPPIFQRDLGFYSILIGASRQ